MNLEMYPHMGNVPKLWDEARGVVLLRIIVLFFDHLRGRQGTIDKRFDITFLQIGFLGLGLRYCVHIFSFGKLKNTAFIPVWDERRCVRGATQLRLACGFYSAARDLQKIPL
jgi:hypothetical protein